MNEVAAQSYVEMMDMGGEAFHANSEAHGFWDDIDEMQALLSQYAPHLTKRFTALVIAEKLALIHSELSEALEAVRKDLNAPDHHVPEFTNFEIEMADAEIRRSELLQRMRLRNGEAILAKHAFNKTRPYKHGKQS